MTTVEALRLRRISETDYETRRDIGRGLRLNGSTFESPLDEPFAAPPSVSLTLLCDASDGDESAPQDTTCFETRHGMCRLTNAHVILGLLAGVPPPPEHEPRLAGLFENLCLARLSRSFLVDVAPVQSAAIGAATSRSTTATSAMQEVGLILVARRGDLSVFSRASAPRAFWRALMSNGHRLPVSGPLKCRRLTVELPLVVATGALPASVVARLDVDDLVQFRTVWLRPDGTGQLRVGHQQVFYRLHADDGAMSLTIEAIHRLDRRSTESLAGGDSMNNSHGFDRFDEDEDEDDADDSPTPADQPTHEEAEVDALAFAHGRNSPPDEQTTVDVRDIDVQVVVELGHLAVSIGELEDLQIGSIMKVSAAGVRSVTVKTLVSGVARQTIAVGELVQVGDSLAVQIKRVFE